MANPYATEAFLRKQCRLRDERCQALELMLRECADKLAEFAGVSDPAVELAGRARVLLADKVEGITAC